MSDLMPILRKKLVAMLAHAALSAIVLGCVIGTLYALFYPGVFFELSGVIEPIKLMVLVDIIVGPLLTFVVFKQNKPSLRFDLSCIVLAQLVAMTYGAYVMIKERPGYLVYAGTKFSVVPLKDVDSTKIKNADIRVAALGKPQIVLLLLPNDVKLAADLVLKEFTEATPMATHAEYYVPLKGQEAYLKSVALKKPQFIARNATYVSTHPSVKSDNIEFFPVDGRTNADTLVLDIASLQAVDVIPVPPY